MYLTPFRRIIVSPLFILILLVVSSSSDATVLRKVRNFFNFELDKGFRVIKDGSKWKATLPTGAVITTFRLIAKTNNMLRLRTSDGKYEFKLDSSTGEIDIDGKKPPMKIKSFSYEDTADRQALTKTRRNWVPSPSLTGNNIMTFYIDGGYIITRRKDIEKSWLILLPDHSIFALLQTVKRTKSGVFLESSEREFQVELNYVEGWARLNGADALEITSASKTAVDPSNNYYMPGIRS